MGRKRLLTAHAGHKQLLPALVAQRIAQGLRRQQQAAVLVQHRDRIAQAPALRPTPWRAISAACSALSRCLSSGQCSQIRPLKKSCRLSRVGMLRRLWINAS
jgi:hypothetical protein